MARDRRWTRRRPAVAALILLVLVGGASGSVLVWRHFRGGQAMSIATEHPGDATGLRPVPEAVPNPPDGQPRFVASVSSDGRYLRDQYGQPILIHGDAPWSLLTDLSPSQAEPYFETRGGQGFNAAIVSLIGDRANGGPSDDGSTYDGLLPFVDGDVTTWQDGYWDRVTRYLRLAADHGITVFLYPIDGWTIGHAFTPKSVEQCQAYGTMVANRLRDLPNLVWMSGGDYFPRTDDPARGSDVDHCIDAMMQGIRSVGDARPFSIQLGYPKSISTDNPYWATRVDWNFVYSYEPTYTAVLEAYARTPAVPALLGEANYEGENNQKNSPPTTAKTLRMQMLWSLTSGAAGAFYGSDDWEFHDGWEQRMDTRSVAQLGRLHRLFAGLPWTRLVPDTTSALVTAGRGTQITGATEADVLQSDYVTASRSPDGRLAVVYLPSARTITVDRTQLAATTEARWVDPASGTAQTTPMSNTFTTPGRNADGDDDWLLVFTRA